MKIVIENNEGLHADEYEVIDVNSLLNETDVEETESVQEIGETYISQNDEEYRLEIFVPGFRKDDFIIEVTEAGQLSIKADTRSEIYSSTDTGEEQEFTEDEFYRSFALPAHVDEQDIQAYYEDDVLTVLIPKY